MAKKLMLLGIILMSTQLVWAESNPLVIAHRGASGYLPEHTLEAKALAYGLGADFIEQDLVLTQDDVPIVLHDIHLDGTTDVAEQFPNKARKDGRFYAIDFTLAQIKQLKVMERLNMRSKKVAFPRRFPRGNSHFQIPTLMEEIELIQGLNHSMGRDVGIYPEIKAPAWHRKEGKDISKIVLKVLADYGYDQAGSNIYLQSFDAQETRRIREELRSPLKLVQLLGENAWGPAYGHTDYDHLKTKAGLAEIAQYANGVGPWMAQIVQRKSTPNDLKITSLVDDAHAAGLLVHPYTFRQDAFPKYVENFDDLLELYYVQLKVDGIFTDFPDRAVKFLQKQTTD